VSKPIAVDLFCGAGGLSLGLLQAGFNLVAGVDSDRLNCQTHRINFPESVAIEIDITQLTAAELIKLAGIGNQKINLLAGSPPCQGFSLMGKRNLNDLRNLLLFEFSRVAIELNPDYILMENVPGIITGNHRKYLVKLMNEFNNAGYTISTKILNAAHYGVPQNRKRLFIVGCRKGLTLPSYPLLATTAPTVWEAIADLPEVNNYPQLLEQDWVEAAEWNKPISDYAAALRYTNRLTSSKRTIHSRECLLRFAKTPPGQLEPISHFHKLNPFGLSPTLRAGTGSDRGSHTAPRPIHPHQPRCITVREGARLQSFPDWFEFHPTIINGFRQLGNSVPPLFAKAIASQIINLLL